MVISVFDRVENIVGKGEIAWTSNFSFTHNVFKRLLSQTCQKVSLCGKGLNQNPSWKWIMIMCNCLTHYQTTNFRLFQNERVWDNNFKFDKNGRKLSKKVENTVGKRRNCSLRAISPFSTVFSKGLFPRGVKRCHCVGMG